MSEFLKKFKDALPEGLKQIADVSIEAKDSFAIALSHLNTLYGKYSEPEFALKSYFTSDTYKANRQIIKRFSDIPEITFEDIEKMDKEEQEYNSVLKSTLDLYEKDCDNNIEKTAYTLGILPTTPPCPIYSHLVAKERITEEDKEKIISSFKENPKLLPIIVTELIRPLTDGYEQSFPAVGEVMLQPHGKYFYRGENAYYKKSKASLYRNKREFQPEYFDESVNMLRLYQCWDTLDKIEAIRKWGFGDVNYMALAQHYGFRTQMLDITSNLKTALFFACCKYGKDGKWHPLEKEDFENRDSRFVCGGDSRYAILYRSPFELSELTLMLDTKNNLKHCIIPVGYQPLMRCDTQYAYMMMTERDDDLYTDPYFDKFKFRLTEEITHSVFEEMKGGNLIYPHSDIPDISAEMDKANRIKVFSESVFNAYCEGIHLNDYGKATLISLLRKEGFSIEKEVQIISRRKLREINEKYTAEHAMERLGITPQLAPMIRI